MMCFHCTAPLKYLVIEHTNGEVKSQQPAAIPHPYHIQCEQAERFLPLEKTSNMFILWDTVRDTWTVCRHVLIRFGLQYFNNKLHR